MRWRTDHRAIEFQTDIVGDTPRRIGGSRPFSNQE
jgi:hypothetical protein